MTKEAERRQALRTGIAAPLSGLRLSLQSVRLIDLSERGACIEHTEPLDPGVISLIDLPPALGRGTLTGRVVWSQLHRTEQTLEGNVVRSYRSGLSFINLTPSQQGALVAALERLGAADIPNNSLQVNGSR